MLGLCLLTDLVPFQGSRRRSGLPIGPMSPRWPASNCRRRQAFESGIGSPSNWASLDWAASRNTRGGTCSRRSRANMTCTSSVVTSCLAVEPRMRAKGTAIGHPVPLRERSRSCRASMSRRRLGGRRAKPSRLKPNASAELANRRLREQRTLLPVYCAARSDASIRSNTN